MVNDVANAPAAAAAGSSGSGDVDLPRAQIKRILQSKLTTGSDAKSLAVSKDAMLAFSESAKVFISYISTTANDIAHESKRQTISAEDVVKAVEELEFAELVAPLKDYMEGAWAAWAMPIGHAACFETHHRCGMAHWHGAWVTQLLVHGGCGLQIVPRRFR